MSKQPIIQKAETYVYGMLEKELSNDFQYHDVDHTRLVVELSLDFGKKMDVTSDELEMLELAALFHDTGYAKTYAGHEQESSIMAAKFLENENYPSEKIERIRNMILSTNPDAKPNTILQKIIKDADLNNLGDINFRTIGLNLRHEWKVFLKRDFDDIGWAENTFEFIDKHHYYTWPAQERLGPQKNTNRKKLKKELKKMKQGAVMKTDKKGTIASSRSAQMMFKTALRNHIDLTSIADSKANMMLSINAIVISITMPLLASQVEGNTFLLIPATILLLTCVLSIIYATLATRPIKMNGLTPLDNVKAGKSNLFFFGNFYKMDNSTYREGIYHVIEREDMLESTIINDLYYLGKALGEKYAQLRICYAIFMIGITCTVIAFAISFIWSNSLLTG